MDRRNFLALLSGLGATAMAGDLEASADVAISEDHVGILYDTTLCIGCRKCEESCNHRNGLPEQDLAFKDKRVFREERRPTVGAFTVVNEYPGAPSQDQEQKKNTYVKVQCMHCIDPVCVSACIDGALTKTSEGVVIYNSELCLGCRYCLYACPFQIPAYEYSKPVMPKVRKCELCVDQEKGTGANPACAQSCPVEALIFGKRNDLLALAHDRLKKRPDRYLNQVYGEREVGGTSWLYLIGRPKEEISLLELQEEAPARLTEDIQHTIFKYGALPVAVYGLLGAVMWRNERKEKLKLAEQTDGEQNETGISSDDKDGEL